MGKIDDLYRRYAVMVNNGSGCLFQTDTSRYTYVLTAKHNIQNQEKTEIFLKENIKVYRDNEQNPENELKVLDVYPHKDVCKDAAILKVKYVDDNINLYHTSLELYDLADQDISVRFFGYPDRRKKLKKKTAGVNCTVDMEHQDGMIEIVPKKVQFGHDADVHYHIKGFSGCGVFKKVNDEILLVGILARLADNSGAGDNILIMPIDYFNEIISQNKGLPPLKPKHLTSFEDYKNEICKGYDDELIVAKNMLESVADGVISKKITPMLIIEQFQEKLCIPYNKDWLNDRALWSGWFELLTYIALEKEIESEELAYLNELLKNKRIYYNNSEENWGKLIKMILKLAPSGLKNVTYVVTIQKYNYRQTRTKVNSRKIIPEIGHPSIFRSRGDINEKSGINIDGSREPNDYIFIHPQEFIKKIEDNRRKFIALGRGDKDKIIQELRNCIKGAFSND